MAFSDGLVGGGSGRRPKSWRNERTHSGASITSTEIKVTPRSRTLARRPWSAAWSGHETAQGGGPVAFVDEGQIVEPRGPVVVDVAIDPEFVASKRPCSAVRGAHRQLTTVFAAGKRAPWTPARSRRALARLEADLLRFYAARATARSRGRREQRRRSAKGLLKDSGRTDSASVATVPIARSAAPSGPGPAPGTARFRRPDRLPGTGRRRGGNGSVPQADVAGGGAARRDGEDVIDGSGGRCRPGTGGRRPR